MERMRMEFMRMAAWMRTERMHMGGMCASDDSDDSPVMILLLHRWGSGLSTCIYASA